MNIALLDRDGTIIAEPKDHRVESPDEISILEGSIEGLRYLAENGFSAIIITNQAGIGEGLITEDEFWALHQVVLDLIKPSGINILKTYMNGDRPGSGSKLRKPSPGMLLQASQEFGFSLEDVFMIGDRPTDVLAGINAGTKTILVDHDDVGHKAPKPDYTVTNLYEAAQIVVSTD